MLTRDSAKYTFKSKGIETKVFVFGAMGSADERAMLILENQPKNLGHSVETPDGQAACIESLSRGMDIKPTDADWFVKDDQGCIRALDVQTHLEKVPNQQFQDYAKAGEFNHQNINEEKKFFMEDIWKAKCEARSPSEAEMQSLTEAFGPEGPTYHEPFSKNPSADVKSAHEYDLSDESFTP